MNVSPSPKSIVALLAALLVILPISGCVLVAPDNPNDFIGPPVLIATEWNGTVYWEARLVFFMYIGYEESVPWKNIQVTLRGEGSRPLELTTDVRPNTGKLTEEPEVFYIDRVGPNDILNRNDVLRVTGLDEDMLPVRLMVVWADGDQTNARIDRFPAASLHFGETATRVIRSNVTRDYRTYLLEISDYYPTTARIRWDEVTVNVVNPSKVLIYWNSSLSTKLDGDGQLPIEEPPLLESPVTVMYIGNDTDPEHISPGDALYFPGLSRDMEDSMVEIVWRGYLIGRWIML